MKDSIVIRDIMSKSDKRTLSIYILLDTSGSTRGEINNIINKEINNLPLKFKEIIEKAKLGDVELRFRVLRYGGFYDDKISWLTGNRTEFDQKISIDSITPEGNTWLSEAITELANSLSEAELGSKPFHPIALIINDGTYSGNEDELLRAMKRLNEVKDTHGGVIVAIASFDETPEPLLNSILTRDRFGNYLVLDDLTIESLKMVTNEIKKSILKPTSSIKEDIV